MTDIQSLNLLNKIALLRLDLNVPMKDNIIGDDTRIIRSLPTIQYLLSQSAKIVILSHLGNPDKDKRNLSLHPVSQKIKDLLPKINIKFIPQCIGKQVSDEINKMKSGEILLLENLRFYEGEKTNNAIFAKELAKLGDVYINDAFACSHRKHASIYELPKLLPSALGLLFAEEIKNINNALDSSSKPIMAIIGGAKISTKITLLHKLACSVDYLVIGGAIANCFLEYNNINIGNSLYERDKKSDIEKTLQIASNNQCKIILPQDVVIRTECGIYNVCQATRITKNTDVIVDIGPCSTTRINNIMEKCRTIIWNGPLGVCNNLPSSVGTATIAQKIAFLTQHNNTHSIIGGGDSIEIANKIGGLQHQYSYVSTGGGAFLKYITDKSLIGMEAFKAS